MTTEDVTVEVVDGTTEPSAPTLAYLDGIDVEAGWLETDDGQIALARIDFLFQLEDGTQDKRRILANLQDLTQICEPLLLAGGWLTEMEEGTAIDEENVNG